jgi:G3E family GTPase
MTMSAERKRPIIVVTGFLGSGKTTLLRHVLTGQPTHGTAVLVNEFGEVGLDHHLVRRLDEQTILLNNGCVCCSVRDDLVQALSSLLDQDQRGATGHIDRLIVETTGLADPAPILFTIETDPMLRHHFRVERVVVTVDAVNGQRHLDRHAVSWKQVAVADDIIITKTDLAPPETVAALTARLRLLNPAAQLTTAVLGEVEPERILAPRHTDVSAQRQVAVATIPPDGQHLGETRSVALTFEQPLDWAAFSVWLSMLLFVHGEDVLRVKGLLNVGEAGPVVLNGVQHIIHAPEHLPQWPNADRRSHLILILQGIDPQQVVTSLQAFQHLLGAQLSSSDMV